MSRPQTYNRASYSSLHNFAGKHIQQQIFIECILCARKHSGTDGNAVSLLTQFCQGSGYNTVRVKGERVNGDNGL